MISAAFCQSACLSNDRARNDVKVEAHGFDHQPYDCDLLEIFFAKVCSGWICEMKEFANDLYDSVEVTRSLLAFHDFV